MNSSLFGLLFISGFILNIQAMENPTLNFKAISRAELNTYAIEHHVHMLTPRSKQLLEERLKELGIDINSGDFIYTALSSNGSRPARPGDVIKFVTIKSYYDRYKQMPPENYRPQLAIQAPTQVHLDQCLTALFGPNGFSCAYPDLPVITQYGYASSESIDDLARKMDDVTIKEEHSDL